MKTNYTNLFLSLFLTFAIMSCGESELDQAGNHKYIVTVLAPKQFVNVNSGRISNAPSQIDYLYYSIIDNDCNSIYSGNIDAYENSFPDSMNLPALSAGDYFLRLEAHGDNDLYYLEGIELEVVSNMTLEVNMENYQTRFTFFDSSNFMSNTVKQIELRVNASGYKYYNVISCYNQEQWEFDNYNHYIEAWYDFPLNGDNHFRYTNPMFANSVMVNFHGDSGLLMSKILYVDEPFWMSESKSYTFEINLTSLWNEGDEAAGARNTAINWIEKDWEEETVDFD